jgi:hypothetical protein
LGDRPWATALFGGLITLVVSLVAGAVFDLRGAGVDDSYIHMHIARNWAAGLGPVFNAGERVEVSTSPGWLALLTLLMWLHVPGPTAASALAAASTTAAGVGVALLAGRLGGWVAALVAPVILALLPAFSIWGATGMETPLAAAVLVWCVWAADRATGVRDAVVVGLLAVALTTVRPESMAIAPVLIGVAILRVPREIRIRAAVAGAAAFALPAVTLLLARHAYFGQWVPNTYMAKMQGIDLAYRMRGVRYVAKFLVLHVPLLAAVGLVPAEERGSVWRVLVVAAGLLAAVAWTGGDHFYYQRLAVPTLVLLCLPLAVTISRASGARRVAGLGLMAAQAPIGLFLTNDLGSLLHEEQTTRTFEEVGRGLRAEPEGTVATIGIGAIAWFSERRILDMVGLADPHIARAPRFAGGKSGHDRGDANYVMERAPEFVLLFAWPTKEPVDDAEEMRQLATLSGCCQSSQQLFKHPQFHEKYEAFDMPLDSGEHQRLWRRKD